MTIATVVKTRQNSSLMCELHVNEWLQLENLLTFTRLFNQIRYARADRVGILHRLLTQLITNCIMCGPVRLRSHQRKKSNLHEGYHG